MMKSLVFLFAFVFLFHGLGFSQGVVDSAAVAGRVDSLLNLSLVLASKKQFKEALQIIDTTKKVAIEIFGIESIIYANYLFTEGLILYFNKDFVKAEQFLIESKNIREKKLGRGHLEYAKSLIGLANLYRDIGENKKSESSYLESISIYADLIGKENDTYASSLLGLAYVYKNEGKYNAAIPLAKEALTIRRRVLNEGNPRFVATINFLAFLYSEIDDLDQAELLDIEVVNIQKKIFGVEHLEYAKSMYNLGFVYYLKGNYEKAEPLYIKSQEITEKKIGKYNKEYAEIINAMGGIYYAKGDFEKAESLYLEAKEIRKKIFGVNDPLYAWSLKNLGNIYQQKGDFERAEQFYLEALHIRLEVSGKTHPDYAYNLDNLANLYYEEGYIDKAENLYLESLHIKEKSLGKANQDYAWSLTYLALVYDYKGIYDRAETLYIESDSILIKVLGRENPKYAIFLSNYANHFFEKKDYDKAELFNLKCLAIRVKKIGVESPYSGMILNKLANIYFIRREINKSKKYFLLSNKISQKQLQKSIIYNSDNEFVKYLRKLQAEFDLLYFFTQKIREDSVVIAAYDNALFLNNALLESAIAREKAIAQADSSTQAIHSEWRSHHFRLSKQYALPIAERDSALVVRLEAEANTLEKELVRRSAGFAQTRRQVEWSQVRDRLKPGETAIEFIHYRYRDAQKAADSTMYAALVLRPGDTAPHFVPLFEKRQLDTLLFHPKDKDAKYYLQQLYAAERKDRLPSLWSLVWKPLDTLLQGVKTVYLSPSGDLHRINFAAISPAEDSVLGAGYHFIPVTSTRQLVISPDTLARQKDALLFGDIRYNLDTTAIRQSNAAIGAVAQDTTGGKLRLATRGMFGYVKEWPPIEGSKAEIDSIGATLKRAGFGVASREGYAATEEAFKQIGQKEPSPRILHISTHGYFFPDPETKASDRAGIDGESTPFKASDHPLIRSGLILAGANHAWKTGRPAPKSEDGILTAYEVAQMNLQNTELVVLSACETGLGDIEGSEGVYGLQRAFKIAGAKHLLMSLWEVPDEATTLLMTRFYRNWLDEKMPMREALGKAQQWLMAQRAVYRNPYFWAGFVLVE